MWSLVLLLPAYVVRFNLAGLPLNVLMVVGFGVAGCLVFRLFQGGQMISRLKDLFSKWPKWFFWSWIFLLIWSVVELFISGLTSENLGQWVVLWGQPLTLVPLVVAVFREGKTDRIDKSFLILLLIDGVVSVLQYFFLIGLPSDYWGNSQEPKRAIGLFVHPNAHSLFITPVLAWMLPLVYSKFLKGYSERSWRSVLVWVLPYLFGVLALFLSLSRGGWMGLAAAFAFFVFYKGGAGLKKLFFAGVIAAVLVVTVVPVVRWRVMLPFYGEKSSVARLSLWNTAFKEVKDDPFFGKGVNGFNLNWYKYNTDQGLLHYNFPHNIILNFWVDFGLPGMLVFVWLCVRLFWEAVKKKSANRYAIPLALMLIAVFVHGLIDIPYLKNDLAMLFWVMVGVWMSDQSS